MRKGGVLLSLDDLRGEVDRGAVDTVLAAFPDLYGRLVGKRLTARHFLSRVAEAGMHVCDYLLTCDMEMDPVQGYRWSSWETGYGDMTFRPDLATLRRAAWLPSSALIFGDLLDEKAGGPVEISPRRMLQHQIERAREQSVEVLCGVEVELYLFNETYDSAREKGYRNLRPAAAYPEDYHLLQGTREEPVMGALRSSLEASGIAVEGTKGEWSPGQQEINLEFGPALEQADRAVIAKHAAREIAYQNGQAVSFMAKWDEQAAGSGLHVHISLWDKELERNLFAGERCGDPGTTRFRHFLAGLLNHSGELTPFFAPNVSSYKRFQAGTFAPTALAWSMDNRTTGYRVVGHGQSLRIECRIPGADANPYLVMAAMLAAGLAGLDEGSEPPAALKGDAYGSASAPQIPLALHAAADAFASSKVASSAFGEAVVEHYAHFFRTEQRKFDAAVTDWEKARFFERV